MPASRIVKIAFTTRNLVNLRGTQVESAQYLPNTSLDPLLESVAYATEEAIINALVAGKQMTGTLGTVYGLPFQRVKKLIQDARGKMSL